VNNLSEDRHPTDAVTAFATVSQSHEFSFIVDDWSDPKLIGQHRCVVYDGKAYPGVIRNVVDECDVEVECALVWHKPNLLARENLDVCWYFFDTVLAVIPEPVKVVSRHRKD